MTGLQPRKHAARLLRKVLEERQPLDGTGDAALSDLIAKDRALIHAIVMAALRRLKTIDAVLDQLIERPLPASAVATTAILRVAAAQLLVLNMPAHAVVTLAVEDAKSARATKGHAGLVNAICRRMVREKDRLLADAPPHDVPDWLARRWSNAYGDETALKIALAARRQPALDLTLNPEANRPHLFAAFEDATRHAPALLPTGGLRLQEAGRIADLPGYDEGQWWVQDFAASLPARALLSALPNLASARVLDLCAAPGGKTAQLAAAGATVTALDISEQRLERLKTNLKRLSLKAQTIAADALTFTPDAPYDAVLLDAPCSATGTIRRHPDLAYVKGEADIKELAALQTKLLRRAALMLRPGGILVFCTCSLEPEEGEAQVARFLEEYSDFELSPLVGMELLDANEKLPHSVFQADGTVRTWPYSVLNEDVAGMDGFYLACLEKSVTRTLLTRS